MNWDWIEGICTIAKDEAEKQVDLFASGFKEEDFKKASRRAGPWTWRGRASGAPCSRAARFRVRHSRTLRLPDIPLHLP